jgi:hypothetical protein
MPPRGRTPQRQPYRPPAREELAPTAPRRDRRGGYLVMILVVVALVFVYVRAFSGPLVPVTNTAPTLNVGQKPGKTAAGATAASPVADYPLVTEVMTSNSGSITAEDGQYYDWIELYNPTGKTINLAGFALSDNLKKPTKCVLPSWTLDPGKYAIIYADGGKSTATELHANFKLKASGSPLMLVDPNGYQLQTINTPSLETNHSFAADMANPTDTSKWAATEKYTPGYPNTNEGYGAYEQTRKAEAKVAISEVMAGNTLTIKDGDGDFSDWVEITNMSDKPIDITGWGLSNKESEPKRWVFPKLTIEPGKYIVVFLSGKNRSEEGKELHADFRANGYKDTVMLSNLRGQVVSEVQINDLKPDESYALVPGTDKWEVFTHPTPGYPNNEEGWNALQPKIYNDTGSPIIISEVMSNNASTVKDQYDEYPDWIDLYNRSDQSVNLKGYALTDKTDELGRWQFPDITLSAGQYLTVFASSRNVKDAEAVNDKKLHTDFSIGGDGGVIALTAPDGKLADRCYVPALRVGDSYGRTGRSLTFSYITEPTPGASSDSGYPGQTPDPLFSIKAGMYDAAQKVELSVDDPEAKIYYTLDGATPTKNSKPYTGAIDMQKTTVVRAVAIRDGYLDSNAVCSTYLIGEGINLPVVSIVTDPKNLFDEQTGIYVNIDKDWERPAHFELIEPDGTVGISQNIGIKISGAQSKKDNSQKSFAVFARNEYGKNSMDYAVFPELPFTSYKDLMIRNSGQDARLSRIRDTLQIGLAQETTQGSVDTQAHRQSVLFVNGEFFGVYDIMEKVNTHFLAQHHNLDPEKIDLLSGNGTVVNGSSDEYMALIEYVKTHDLSVRENYNYVASKMDIDSYIDWCTIEIYTGNSDLGNIKFWKPQTPDGKWRWILFDMDWGFFYTDQEKYASYQDLFSKFLNPQGNGVGHRFSTALILGLLKNEEFKDKFIKRFVYHATVTFETSRVLQRIEDLHNNIEPYMARDKEKFPKDAGNVTTWHKQLDILKKFAQIRPEMNLKYLQKYFNLSDAEMNALKGN